MSVFDLFRTSPAPAPAPVAPPAAPPQNPVPAPTNPAPENNPAAPNQQSQTNGNTPNGQPTAMDAYKDLFAPPKAPEGVPAPTHAVAFDQQAVAQQVNAMDFMKAAKPEDLQAIVAGGEPALAAFGNVINAVMRQAVTMNTSFAASAANRAADHAYARSQESVPELLRTQLVQGEFKDPAHNHPALAPVVKGLTQQFQMQYPKATAAEVATHVRGYLQAIGQAFATPADPAAQQKASPAAEKPTDWSAWSNS